MIPIFVIIPLGAAFLIPVFSKIHKNFAVGLANITAALLLFFSVRSIFWLQSGIKIYKVGGWVPPFGICMVLDALTVFMLLVVNITGCFALVYSIDYVKNKYTGSSFYYTLFCLLLAGLNGVVITGDLFNLFVFLEITSIASYALVSFGVEAEELEASFKYLVLGSIASTLVLFAIGLLLGKVSTLNMADISLSLASSGAQSLTLYCIALFIAGFGLKSGIVPMHTWLPDAHPAAPAPMSAMLSGVVIKTIGIYALARVIFNIIGFTGAVSSLFIWLGIISMVVGGLLAVGQSDIKRLLAYSSISQVGYIVFAFGLGTPLGIAGGLFHIFSHFLSKSLLFLNAGSIEYATGTRDLVKLSEFEKNMPVTSSSSLVASLSIAGIPPLPGFWSKLIIIIASFQANNIIGAWVCILVSVLTLAVFLRFQKYTFLRKMAAKAPPVNEVPFFMKLSTISLTLLCIIAGLLFPVVFNKLIQPAAEVLIQGTNYARIILGG